MKHSPADDLWLLDMFDAQLKFAEEERGRLSAFEPRSPCW